MGKCWSFRVELDNTEYGIYYESRSMSKLNIQMNINESPREPDSSAEKSKKHPESWDDYNDDFEFDSNHSDGSYERIF